MTRRRYAVTAPRNSQTQHWRGKLRGYAVTAPCVCMCAGAWVRACGRAGVYVRGVRNRVTA